ncbi:MAG TPA: hypothetical protein VGI43_10175 [Mucilaginibacter sp.]|jgi:hypothetical protein
MFKKNCTLFVFFSLIGWPAALMAQHQVSPDSVSLKLPELDKMRGTWLLTYPDTSKSGEIHQDSVVTTFKWSANRDTLSGVEQIKNSLGISLVYIRYSFDKHSGQYFYIESDDPVNLPASAPLIVNGDTWIYPIGDDRVLNKFSVSGKLITYYIQYRNNGQWVTRSAGRETKIK